MTERVSLHRAGVAYEGHPVLHDIDLALGEHERVALIGANGCGKSSLLRLIHGLLPLCSGQRLQDPNTRLGMMFQRPHMLNTTTQRHVAIGPWLAGMAWRRSMDLAMEALSRVGLEHVAAQSARTLSGGQQQRVALARALIMQPRVLLLDEPLSALDPFLRIQMRAELRHWQKELGLTFIHVTHSQEEAMALADTMVVMNHGRIEQFGSPQTIFGQPASEFVARFMGGHNILKSSQGLVAVRGDRIQVSLANASVSQPGMQATLTDIEYQGSFSLLTFRPLETSQEPMTVMLPEQSVDPNWQVGLDCHLHWAEADSHVLGPDLVTSRSPLAA